MLIENRSLTEETGAIHAPVGLFVGVNTKMLREMRLLPEALAAFRTRIWPWLYMNASVLEKRWLLLKFLLADGATDVQRHCSTTEHIRKFTAFQILQRQSWTKDRMTETFCIFKISRVLSRVTGRKAGPALFILPISITESWLHLFLVLVRKRYVLGPECRRCSILEDEMRRNVCKNVRGWSVTVGGVRERLTDEWVNQTGEQLQERPAVGYVSRGRPPRYGRRGDREFVW